MKYKARVYKILDMFVVQIKEKGMMGFMIGWRTFDTFGNFEKAKETAKCISSILSKDKEIIIEYVDGVKQ